MDESLYERIKQYKKGLLSISERQAFEAQLASDPELAREVSVWASVQLGIAEEGDEQLRHQLFDLGTQLLQEGKADDNSTQTGAARKWLLPRRVWAAAAAVLLLISGFWLVQRWNTPASPVASAEMLYDKYYIPLPATGTRDGSDETWKQLYNQKRYKETIVMIEGLLQDTAYSARSEASLYLGLAKLNEGQAGQSVSAFRQVGQGSYWWEHAQWYEALALLKSNDLNAAKNKLQMIENQTGSTYKIKAAELLRQLQ